MSISNVVEFTESCWFEIRDFAGSSDPFFFQDELNRFFRLPDEAERVWDPPELIGICWGNRQAQAGSISR